MAKREIRTCKHVRTPDDKPNGEIHASVPIIQEHLTKISASIALVNIEVDILDPTMRRFTGSSLENSTPFRPSLLR